MKQLQLDRLDNLHAQQKWTIEELEELARLYRLFFEEVRAVFNTGNYTVKQDELG